MIKPAGRHDWWQIPLDVVKQLPLGLPGLVSRANGVFEVHRSHLPILAELGFEVPVDDPADEVDGDRGVTFRPWQRRAHAWARARRGTLMVAEPRMGKSPLGLSLHDPSRGPLVILAPLDVRQVWIDWVGRMFPGADVLTLEGHTVDIDAIRAAEFVFAHYDIVAHQRLTSLIPGTLIVDEAHLLSNADSARSKGVRFFATLAKRVIVLTGTPLWNSTKGLWPLLAIANPGAWGEKPFSFRQRYCDPTVSEYGWKYGEISNPEEWAARRNEVVFQADWKTERPDLVPATRRFIDVPVDADMLMELDLAVEAIRNNSVEDSAIGVIGRYRRMTGQLKVTPAAAAAMELCEPCVVWAWHRDVAAAVRDTVLAQDRDAFLIHGGKGENAKKRLTTIDRWRASQNGILCATMAVGQVGIDLSHARRAVMAEFDWTPAVLYQTEMRTFDPERSMELIYPRVAHPVENLLIDKVVSKLERAETSSMPAAGSGFALADSEGDSDSLLAALDEIIAGSTADFRGVT